jgi:hypothetical protein
MVPPEVAVDPPAADAPPLDVALVPPKPVDATPAKPPIATLKVGVPPAPPKPPAATPVKPPCATPAKPPAATVTVPPPQWMDGTTAAVHAIAKISWGTKEGFFFKRRFMQPSVAATRTELNRAWRGWHDQGFGTLLVIDPQRISR